MAAENKKPCDENEDRHDAAYPLNAFALELLADVYRRNRESYIRENK